MLSELNHIAKRRMKRLSYSTDDCLLKGFRLSFSKLNRYFPNSQNAIALAAATLRESTP